MHICIHTHIWNYLEVCNIPDVLEFLSTPHLSGKTEDFRTRPNVEPVLLENDSSFLLWIVICPFLPWELSSVLWVYTGLCDNRRVQCSGRQVQGSSADALCTVCVCVMNLLSSPLAEMTTLPSVTQWCSSCCLGALKTMFYKPQLCVP